jgi:hypothetical protein
LGLRLADLEEMDLESERVHFRKRPKRSTLKANGAADREIDFLLSGRRVELNAMTMPQLLAWIERKLTANGVEKIVPNDDTLAAAYRQMAAETQLQARVAKIGKKLEREWRDAGAPRELRERVQAVLREHPSWPWDAALRRVVEGAGVKCAPDHGR